MNPMLSLFNFSSKGSRRRPPDGPNRRQSFRYPSQVPVLLGWWVEEEFLAIHGTLLDVSQGGVAVVLPTEETPPEGEAHLRLAEIADSPWVEVEILSVRVSTEGLKIAHLQFIGSCSYAFFRHALPSTLLDTAGVSYASEVFDTRYWR